jgi:hypothetical protein
MQKVYLKIVSVLLCGLLIYNSLGHLLVFSVIRMSVRHQMWSQLSTIPESSLTTFIFDKNSARQRLSVVNKREIKVDGRMYDVVRKTVFGKNVKYVCINDEKEEILLSKAKLVNSQSEQQPGRNIARVIAAKIISSAIITDETEDFDTCTFAAIIIFEPAPDAGPGIQVTSPPPKS